jgi:hypothetical protein
MSSKKHRAKKVQVHRGTIVFWCYGVWGPVNKDNPIKELLVRDGAYSIPYPDDGNIPRAVLAAARELFLGGLIGWKLCYTLKEIEAMVADNSNPAMISGSVVMSPRASSPKMARN